MVIAIIGSTLEDQLVAFSIFEIYALMKPLKNTKLVKSYNDTDKTVSAFKTGRS